jgi:hypothetical protein
MGCAAIHLPLRVPVLRRVRAVFMAAAFGAIFRLRVINADFLRDSPIRGTPRPRHASNQVL